jgi:F-type H+-transporting ATPase subunit b
MLLLSASITSPGIGTIFWATFIFSLFLLILTKFAWKPIMTAVKARDEMIKGSLASAAKAREEMIKLQSDNEIILRKAREDRELILKEARDLRDKLIAEAKGKASEEAEKLVEKARTGIEREKGKLFQKYTSRLHPSRLRLLQDFLVNSLKRQGSRKS